MLVIRPSICAILVALWNLAGDANTHTADRVVYGIILSIVVECLYLLGLVYLAWALVVPGILILTTLITYRFFFDFNGLGWNDISI